MPCFLLRSRPSAARHTDSHLRGGRELRVRDHGRFLLLKQFDQRRAALEFLRRIRVTQLGRGVDDRGRRLDPAALGVHRARRFLERDRDDADQDLGKIEAGGRPAQRQTAAPCSRFPIIQDSRRKNQDEKNLVYRDAEEPVLPTHAMRETDL